MIMSDTNTDDDMPVLPRLDEHAPPFEGRSTHGPTKLSDFHGKWLVFFAHPADFTPVCASELVAFAKRAAEFAALNCALLGLSVDSVYAHLAWHESIRQKIGVNIGFPVLEDVSMEIARRYGMVRSDRSHPSTVRALYVIDEQGILRAMLMYPVTIGRSVDEVLRLLQALQAADRLHALTPEGWRPGDNVIEPPPDTLQAVSAGRQPVNDRDATYGCVDWYYWTRPAASA
jgi:peroxiredoxin (alkyl hydroperoxide reductase subunit C)